MTDADESPRIGRLEPRFVFFLNPYRDERFTRCPECGKPTRTRKEPFFIHIDPMEPVVLNMTGRYCPQCDVLILHQDVVEDLLVRALEPHKPEVIGHDYLIVGTLDRAAWRGRGSEPTLGPAIEQLHDFKEVVRFEAEHGGWVPSEDDEAE